MKIDLDYIRGMLQVWLESESESINVRDLSGQGFNYNNEDNTARNPKFMFHFRLLVENELISNLDLERATMKNTGVEMQSCTIVELRLTQTGHDFANTLSNREVFEKLKENFKDAPFKVIFDSGRKLFEHYCKKRLDNLTDES